MYPTIFCLATALIMTLASFAAAATPTAAGAPSITPGPSARNIPMKRNPFTINIGDDNTSSCSDGGFSISIGLDGVHHTSCGSTTTTATATCSEGFSLSIGLDGIHSGSCTPTNNAKSDNGAAMKTGSLGMLGGVLAVAAVL